MNQLFKDYPRFWAAIVLALGVAIVGFLTQQATSFFSNATGTFFLFDFGLAFIVGWALMYIDMQSRKKILSFAILPPILLILLIAIFPTILPTLLMASYLQLFFFEVVLYFAVGAGAVIFGPFKQAWKA